MKPTSPTPSYNSDSTATDLDYSEYTLYQPNTPPTTRLASISPPPSRRRKISNAPNSSNIDAPVTLSHPSKRNLKFRDDEDNDIVKLADIEAVEVSIDDHVEYFSRRLSRVVNGRGALLGFGKWRELYERNLHERGRHFVVHQHDHPIAGVHYDLRLQISGSSSISFAIMYGLPGNPNSRRLNRNATETRVHCLWNHLIESASSTTGSLLIWDTGEYSILPYHQPPSSPSSSPEPFSPSTSSTTPTHVSESEKLHQAFQNRRIRIRLHGHRLPPNYTISLRLLPGNDRDEQPKAPVRKRRRRNPDYVDTTPDTSDDDALTAGTTDVVGDKDSGNVSAGEKVRSKEIEEEEDEITRKTNAYPGAKNTIGSVYQRRWFLSMDRVASGFQSTTDRQGEKRWVKSEEHEDGGKKDRKRARREGGKDEIGNGRVAEEEGFIVRGRDIERSILTGRNADEVMRDEDVEGFVGRKGWRAVVE